MSLKKLYLIAAKIEITIEFDVVHRRWPGSPPPSVSPQTSSIPISPLSLPRRLLLDGKIINCGWFHNLFSMARYLIVDGRVIAFGFQLKELLMVPQQLYNGRILNSGWFHDLFSMAG